MKNPFKQYDKEKKRAALALNYQIVLPEPIPEYECIKYLLNAAETLD